MRKRKVTCTLFLTALVAAAPAGAQIQPFNIFVDNLTQTQVLRNSIARAEARKSEAGARTPDIADGVALLTASKPQTASASLPFTHDPAVSRRVQQQLLAGVREQTPEGAEEVRAALNSGEMRRAFDAAMPPLGLKANDALDVLAVYIMTAWGVTNDTDVTPDRAMVRAVRGQVGRAYASTADLLNTPAERQEFGEALIYQSVILSQLLDAMRKMPADQRRTIADRMHRASLPVLGYDLRDIRLTPQGFRPRDDG